MVVARPRRFTVFNPELNVSEASQSRARKQGQRNVHAYVTGTEVVVLDDSVELSDGPTHELYYNPYKYDTFVDAKTRKPVTKVKAVLFEGDKAYYTK